AAGSSCLVFWFVGPPQPNGKDVSFAEGGLLDRSRHRRTGGPCTRDPTSTRSWAGQGAGSAIPIDEPRPVRDPGSEAPVAGRPDRDPAPGRRAVAAGDPWPVGAVPSRRPPRTPATPTPARCSSTAPSVQHQGTLALTTSAKTSAT